MVHSGEVDSDLGQVGHALDELGHGSLDLVAQVVQRLEQVHVGDVYRMARLNIEIHGH